MSVVIVAYNAYVDSIQAAHAGGADARIEAGRALLRHWRELAQVARSIGVEVPGPPAELEELSP
jgi:hypothetical protein